MLTRLNFNFSHKDIFQYDKVANRTVADGVTYVPNNLNQYTSVGAQTYLYDNNGNLTNDGTNTYTYDEEDRLSSLVSPSSSATYTYDGFNRRVSKTVNGVTTYFINDGDREIEERDATGALTADYVYGDDIDEVLTMSRNGNTSYYHYDGLGSVTELTDASGTVVENYTYDPYGAPSVTSSIGNPFYFTGRRLDTESGLYYYRARMYSPTIGRFLQRDPIGYYDSMNLMQYVGNNPVNYLDPWGLQMCKLSDEKMQELMDMVISATLGPAGEGEKAFQNIVVPGGKKAVKEALKRLNTIRQHWQKYRNPRDYLEKGGMRKQIRKMIREFRKRFEEE